MPHPYRKLHAVVVMPAGSRHVQDDAQRRWISYGRLEQTGEPQEPLLRVLSVIDQPLPTEGLAAMRLWGQTGDRPGIWIAAADPVHLEAMLDHLRIRSFDRDQVSLPELRDLYRSIQDTLGNDDTVAFVRIGRCGYLRGATPIATAAVSTEQIDQRRPDEFPLLGGDTAGHDGLLSELQMTLHAHRVNERRAEEGQRTVNSLWLWGGGFAPDTDIRDIFPLFSNDPLFKGYWRSCSGTVNPWKGDFVRCLRTDADGFVVATRSAPAPIAVSQTGSLLAQLREMQRSRRLSRLTLVFRDGVHAELRRYDRLRLWRRRSALLGAA